jgi:ABC-type dipeptide/oligopeptide/nickel transport system permease component
MPNFWEAISQADYPVVQAVVLTVSLLQLRYRKVSA